MVMRHLNRLARAVFEALFLEVNKIRWNGALRNLLQWKMSLLLTEVLELDGL